MKAVVTLLPIICCMRPNISPLVAYISLRHICLSTVPLSYGLLLGCGAKTRLLPCCCGGFSLFIVYQLYRYTFTHSLLLILITILDVFVIALTLLEYRRLRHGENLF